MMVLLGYHNTSDIVMLVYGAGRLWESVGSSATSGLVASMQNTGPKSLVGVSTRDSTPISCLRAALVAMSAASDGAHVVAGSLLCIDCDIVTTFTQLHWVTFLSLCCPLQLSLLCVFPNSLHWIYPLTHTAQLRVRPPCVASHWVSSVINLF